MLVEPYNPRNTDDPLDLEYRVEDQIKEHSNTARLYDRHLYKTDSHRSRVETAIGICNDLGLGPVGLRGRVRVKSHVFMTHYLQRTISLANHHRRDDGAISTVRL